MYIYVCMSQLTNLVADTIIANSLKKDLSVSIHAASNVTLDIWVFSEMKKINT